MYESFVVCPVVQYATYIFVFKLISSIIRLVDWFIYFNFKSTYLGLFYAERLGNCAHCTFIFTFFVQIFPKRFIYLVIYLHTILLNMNNFLTDLMKMEVNDFYIFKDNSIEN